MYIIYKSKQNMRIGFLSIYFLIFLLLSYLIFMGGANTWLSIFLLFDVFLFLNFFKLNFIVTNNGIGFGFGIFRRNINRSQIDSIFIDDSSGNFHSLGIMFERGAWGFIAKKGGGLKIKLKNNAVFFVSQENPAKILEVIKQQKYV